jgi:septum formation protein
MTSLNSMLRLPARLVLASRSPRRQHLLRTIGFEFDVVVPDVDEESIVPQAPYHTYVETLARMKAHRGAELAGGDCMVIGSDTTVVLDDVVLNKPATAAEAHRMLRSLSGRTHTVFTGLALSARIGGAWHDVQDSRATQVTFRDLAEEEISAYVDGGSPMDKAGAYGIQDDLGAVFVRRVEGCYYTVVGLPLELLYTMLRDLVARLA